MSTSPDIGIPFLADTQQQPEVTHNEALLMLQMLTKGVISIGTNTPPGSPTVGDMYVIGSAPTGAWAGRANCVTLYQTGGWRFLPDRDSSGTIITMGIRHEGMRVWKQGAADSPPTDGLYVWDGASWVQKI